MAALLIPVQRDGSSTVRINRLWSFPSAHSVEQLTYQPERSVAFEPDVAGKLIGAEKQGRMVHPRYVRMPDALARLIYPALRVTLRLVHTIQTNQR